MTHQDAATVTVFEPDVKAACQETDRQSLLPPQWHSAKLGDVTTSFVSGGTPSTVRAALWDGTVPWTTSAPIGEHATVLDCAQRFITEQALTSSATHIVPANNLLVGTRVGVGKAVVNLLDIAISQDLTGVVLDRTRVLPEFVAYQFKTHRVQGFLDGRKRGTTIKGISRFDLQSVTLYLPSLPEQHAIAHVLRTVQDAIQTRSRELELERERKAALMQHLFTYGTRGEPTKQTEIGEMPESWQVVQLGQVLSVLLDHRGQTPKKLGGDFTTSGVRVISAMNIKDGRLMLDRNVRYVSYEMYNRWMPEKLRINDVLLTSEAPLGAVALLEQDAAYCLSQRLFALRANSSILDAHFLFHALRSEGMQSTLQARASGTTAFGIRQSELVRVPLEMPPLAEQRAIAETLTACDGKMSAMGEEIALLEELFGALLEELMTGRLSTLPLIEAEDEAAV